MATARRGFGLALRLKTADPPGSDLALAISLSLYKRVKMDRRDASHMANPFEVSADTLAGLSDVAAKDLVRAMIAAESDSANVRLDQICTGGAASAPDKGIDFEVRGAPQESAGGLIKKGRTAYQVKSGRRLGPSQIAGILFKGGDLRESVRECLSGGGTLVVVLTK